MTRQENDDVGSLFKAIGAKTKQFKEFGTQNNAAQAQERWPLFKTLDLEKRPPPPLLQSSEKKVWAKSPNPPAPIAPASRKTAPSLGQQIAKGLHTLGRPVLADNPPEPAMAAPAPALRANPGLRKTLAGSIAAAPAPAPAPSLAPAPASRGKLFASTKPGAPAAAAPTAAPVKGLFAKTAPDAPVPAPPKKSLFGKTAAPESTPDTDSSNLSSLFARLEQPEPSKGLFGRKRKS